MGALWTHSFMASIIVRSQSDRVYRHGKTPAGRVRYRCLACPHVFQLTYTYEARKPGVKDKIVEMAFNGAGVRDTARVLKIGINTVLCTLKNPPPTSDIRATVPAYAGLRRFYTCATCNHRVPPYMRWRALFALFRLNVITMIKYD